jgi:ArsR family transcriptional regulator
VPTAAAREATHAQRCFHALSDETRLRLLDLLRAGEQCVCDLTDSLDTGQSRLSFHLKVLKDAGLVTDRYYALDLAALDSVVDFLSGLRPRRGGLRLAPRRCD